MEFFLTEADNSFDFVPYGIIKIAIANSKHYVTGTWSRFQFVCFWLLVRVTI